jgi:hypothetical protein
MMTSLPWCVVCAQLGQNGGGCGCGVSVVLYTSCRVQHMDNIQTLWNFPPFFCNDKMIPHAW